MYDREKRKRELTDILRPFKEKSEESGIDFRYKTEPEEIILNAYEMLLNERLKAMHEDKININIYKVASGLEMAINYCQPIECDDPKLAGILNAQLAMEVAFSFVFAKNMTIDDYSLTPLEKKILQEHHELLVYSDTESIFDSLILNNSLFWKALYCSVFQRLNISQEDKDAPSVTA